MERPWCYQTVESDLRREVCPQLEVPLWFARMLPRTLDEYIGQEYILSPGKLLRCAIEADRMFPSIFLWHPSGTGKTSLVLVIVTITKSRFETL